jgi:hypothetical protein
MNIRLVCNHGLGNRVTAIANALSFRPDTVQMGWAVNKLCPLDWHEVFPDGLPGVEFEAPKVPRLSSRLRGIPSESWHAAADRAEAAAAYRLIMTHMAGRAHSDPPAVAVCARFLTARRPDPSALVDTIPSGERVFVLADSRRSFLSERIRQKWGQPIQPLCPELPSEHVRTPGALRLFLSDWHTLLSAKLIIATPNPTSLLHPAHAQGTPVRTP